MKLIVTVLFLSLTLQLLLAQPGMLRKDFADDGIFSLDITNEDEIQGVAYLDDGSVVAVGYAYSGNYDGIIICVSPEGDLKWQKTIDVTGNDFNDFFQSVVVIEDEIIVQSNSFNSDRGSTEIVVFSYSVDGDLNPDFGVNGRASYYYDNGVGAFEMEVDEDDNIYLIGRTLGFLSQNDDGMIIKINREGELDANFGDGGYSKQSIGSFRTGLLNAMIIDNEVYAVGWWYDTGTAVSIDEHGVVIKVKEDGSRDLDFASNGTLNFDLNNDDIITDVSRHGQDHFLILASSGSPDDMFLRRYDLSGNLDTSFGNNGTVKIDLGEDDDSDDLLVRSDLGIYACGSVNSEEDFAVISFDANGQLDMGFGDQGVLIVDIDDNDNLSEAVLLPNGDILLGGESSEGNDGDIAIVLVEGYQTCSSVTVEEALSDCISVTFDGQEYTETGLYPVTFQKADGCDSIVNLQVTIFEATSAMVGLKECSSITINAETYTESGTYQQVLANANGCDSILTVNAVILSPTSETIMESACEPISINGEDFGASGTFTQVLTNAEGCDSTLTLIIEINEPLSEISLDGDSLVSLNTGELYQWFDCATNAEIEGATGSTFKPEISGEYALQITSGECSNLSDCLAVTVTSSNDDLRIEPFEIYPNPTADRLNITGIDEVFTHVEVLNVLGQVMTTKLIQARGNMTIDVQELSAGSYFLILKDQKGILSSKRFVKVLK